MLRFLLPQVTAPNQWRSSLQLGLYLFLCNGAREAIVTLVKDVAERHLWTRIRSDFSPIKPPSSKDPLWKRWIRHFNDSFWSGRITDTIEIALVALVLELAKMTCSTDVAHSLSFGSQSAVAVWALWGNSLLPSLMESPQPGVFSSLITRWSCVKQDVVTNNCALLSPLDRVLLSLPFLLVRMASRGYMIYEVGAVFGIVKYLPKRWQLWFPRYVDARNRKERRMDIRRERTELLREVVPWLISLPLAGLICQFALGPDSRSSTRMHYAVNSLIYVSTVFVREVVAPLFSQA